MLADISFLIFMSVVNGFAIAKHYPHYQWLKLKTGTNYDCFEELELSKEEGNKLSTKQSIQRLFGKALNCESCMSFWSFMLFSLLFTNPWIVLMSPLAYAFSSMIVSRDVK